MLISIETALHHLRADPDDAPDVQRKLDAAIEMAEQFMSRRIYATAAERDNAVAEVTPDATALIALRNGLATDDPSEIIQARLKAVNSELASTLMVFDGIVMNAGVEAAILLTLGTLYEHREDVVVGTSIVKLPQGAEYRLQPYRVMGV